MSESREIEIWAGLEATINRVGDDYFDQSEYSGHYTREGDMDLIASLGATRLRYPLLWEKHQPQKDTVIDWSHAEKNLSRLRELQIKPIAGLVHHGSGPLHVNFFDGSFEQGVADYAAQAAEKFPWIEYYTPINEPLTTARFCGLYGHWHPHLTDSLAFYKILLSECKATGMAMQRIREINPHAKLIQTEDLSKTYSTPLLQYQADLENQRRWLSYDLLCGRVNELHPLWDYLTRHVRLSAEDLSYFVENPCVPDICGINYYVTSERYLDEDLSKYPPHCHGGNEMHRYADTEKIRVSCRQESGAYVLLKEAYEHLRLPIAVTECHLHCTREEQMRWFNDMWLTVNRLREEGTDIQALTAWSVFGAYGWNTLVTKPRGTYEPGAFDLRDGLPRPTALASLIREIALQGVCNHPVLETEGWWKRDSRILYPAKGIVAVKRPVEVPACRPLLIIEDGGSLSTALVQICCERNIRHILLGRSCMNPENQGTVQALIHQTKPWAIIYTGKQPWAEYGEHAVDKANPDESLGSKMLSDICCRYGIKQVVISPNYFEKAGVINRKEYDAACPLHPKAPYSSPRSILKIRTGNLFGPWDNINFITDILASLRQGKTLGAANDVYTFITYVPDMMHEMLNLLLDNEQGDFYLTSRGRTTWASITLALAELAGYSKGLINSRPFKKMQLPAGNLYSVAFAENIIPLPAWENALQRYLAVLTTPPFSGAIAV